NKARDDVELTTCRRGANQAHWPRRIRLRPRDARHRRQGDSARGQMQELSTMEKFHDHPPRVREPVQMLSQRDADPIGVKSRLADRGNSRQLIASVAKQ